MGSSWVECQPESMWRLLSVRDDEHPAVGEHRLPLLVGGIGFTKTFQAALLKCAAHLVVGQGHSVAPHRGAAHPVENRLRAVHDLQIFGLPDVHAARYLAESFVI